MIEMKNKSDLIIKDLFISHFNFDNKERKIGQNKFNVEYDLNFDLDENLKQNTVKIHTVLQTEEKNMHLELEIIGIFQLNDNDLSDDIKKELLTKNTVAIMMPYVRNEITLLTSQPGMMPIILPIIDVNKLVNNHSKKEKSWNIRIDFDY